MEQVNSIILEMIADAEQEAGESRNHGQSETIKYFVLSSELKIFFEDYLRTCTSLLSEREFLTYQESSCNFLRLELDKLTYDKENEMKIHFRYLRHYKNIRNIGVGHLVFKQQENKWQFFLEESFLSDMRFTTGD